MKLLPILLMLALFKAGSDLLLSRASGKEVIGLFRRRLVRITILMLLVAALLAQCQ